MTEGRSPHHSMRSNAHSMQPVPVEPCQQGNLDAQSQLSTQSLTLAAYYMHVRACNICNTTNQGCSASPTQLYNTSPCSSINIHLISASPTHVRPVAGCMASCVTALLLQIHRTTLLVLLHSCCYHWLYRDHRADNQLRTLTAHALYPQKLHSACLTPLNCQTKHRTARRSTTE